ncbi:hypothetical protein GQ53DRAFT_748183 [Thozetella sp. PMI_491]|nr:hypothetical protein GQ53DRAFT_748183 [Thozetella sp. PMI_491]
MTAPPARTASALGEGLALSKDEARILELFDRLQDLQYRIALARAQSEYRPDDLPVDEGHVKQAQARLLESRAYCQLRDHVLDSVLAVNPILQAVHRGSLASPIERDLLPFVEARDAVAGDVARQAVDLKESLGQLTEVEVESVQIGRRNVQLAAEVSQLVDAARIATEPHLVRNPRLQESAAQLERELWENRRMWRMAKEAAGATVVGSGADWARDQQLRRMVLDTD